MDKNTVTTQEWLKKTLTSKATICLRFAEFKRRRIDMNDAERSGRSNAAVSSKDIKKIH